MTQPDKRENGHLQHEAEHVRPTSRANVMTYLVVLFGAAFLLLLLSYFMQQRNASETIDTLKASMSNLTSMKSIEELQSENELLKDQVEELQDKIDALQAELTTAEDKMQDFTQHKAQVNAEYDALTYLNQIRALYNQKKPADAREMVAAADSALSEYGGLEAILTTISAKASDHEKEVYDPLAAYQTILGWLNK